MNKKNNICIFLNKMVYEDIGVLSFLHYNMNMSITKFTMEDEIKSQSKIIGNLINKYVINYCILMDIPLQINRIVIIASGSSYNAGLYGKYFLENISQVETSVEYASEFSENKFNNYTPDCLYIFISQSGNSADVLKSIERVKEKGVKTLCITNNQNSKLYELSDFKFLIEAGEEQAIAATKTFSASVVMIWLIALKIAQNKHLDISNETKNITLVEKNIESVFDNIENLDIAAKLISKQKEFSIAGFNLNYPLSRETALKIKEVNYINTSSYPLGEFIHGHFALLNKSKVFLTFMFGEISEIEKKLLEKITSTYKAKTIIISDEYEDYNCDILIKFPSMKSNIATIIASIITIQLLTLNIAQKLKRNVDKPKGLSKVCK